MVVNYPKSVRTFVIAFTCATGFMAAACAGTESSPTGPSSSPDAPSAPPAEPGSPAALSVSISPNPVPWSSNPVPNCNLANRWHYEQTLKNVGGTKVTISDRADFFDGAAASKRSGLAIVLDPDQETTIATSWCSANNIEHRAHTNFSGSDEGGNHVTLTGTTVRLQPK